MRHGVGLLANDEAFKMDPADGRVNKAIAIFLDRCRKADPESARELEEQTERLLAEWRAYKRNSLLYSRRPRERMLPNLLRNIFEPPEKGLWETMQSMRSVDRVSQMRVVKPHNPRREGGRHAAT